MPQLSLAELELYATAGNKLALDSANLTLSSEAPGHSAAMCVDGDLDTSCQAAGSSPTLALVYTCEKGSTALSRVEVYGARDSNPDDISFYTLDFFDASGQLDAVSVSFQSSVTASRYTVRVIGESAVHAVAGASLIHL